MKNTTGILVRGNILESSHPEDQGEDSRTLQLTSNEYAVRMSGIYPLVGAFVLTLFNL
jgi:hypothetical protein